MSTSVKNVLLIVVDALRVDRVGSYSNVRLTPNIDALADEGEVFEQCYSCINATDPSLTTILTGQYPMRHGIVNHGNRITEEEQRRVSGTQNLAERINDTHMTIAVDTLNRWHQRGFTEYLPKQFNEQTDRSWRAWVRTLLVGTIRQLPDNIEQNLRLTYHRIGRSGRSSQLEVKNITDMTIGAIERSNDPWFGLAHYWDTHVPYTSNDTYSDVVAERSYDDSNISIATLLDSIDGSRWAQRLRDGLLGDAETVGDMKRQYDSAVWRTDHEIGRLIEYLEASGELEETAIIVTADHGESLTEHGIFFDHHGLYSPSIHVPLIVKAPGFKGRETSFIQHFDIAPTLMELLGKEYNEEWFDGTSLVLTNGRTRRPDRDAIYAEEAHTARKRTIQTDSYKYITRLDGNEKCRYCDDTHASAEELYDLKADPTETENIVAARPEAAASLAKALESWIEGLPNPRKSDIDFEESQEAIQRLKDMGYL